MINLLELSLINFYSHCKKNISFLECQISLFDVYEIYQIYL